MNSLIKKSAFYSAVTFGLQGVNLLTLILLKSAVPDSTFADYLVYLAMSAVVSTALCLRYDKLIPILKTEVDISNAITISASVLCAGAAVMLVANLFLQTDYLGYIAVISMLTGLILVFNSKLQQQGHSKFVLIGRSLQVGTLLAYALAVTFFEQSGDALVIALILSLLLNLSVVGFYLRKSIHLSISRVPEYLSHIKIHRRYLYFVTPEAVMNIATPNMPLFILAQNYSAEATALYGFIYRLLSVPASNISQSINFYLYPKMANMDKAQKIALITKVCSFGFGAVALLNIVIVTAYFVLNAYLDIDFYQEILIISMLAFFLGINAVFNTVAGLNLILGLEAYSLYVGAVIILLKSLMFYVDSLSYLYVVLYCNLIDLAAILIINAICIVRLVRS